MAQNLKEAAASGQSVRFKNTMRSSRTIKVTFTADAQAAATSEIFLFPGRGNAAAKQLPANVTFGGDYPTYADYLDMITNVKFGVESIMLETSLTDNYEGTEFAIGKRNLNNKNNREQPMYLSKFQVSQGNGVKKTAEFDVDSLDGGIMVNAQLYGVFRSLLQGTSITFYIKVSHEETIGELDPADF